MNEIVPRFEFRIFTPCMGVEEQRMRAMATCESISESHEIYLLGYDGVLDKNVKIRHGKLELKRLMNRERGLERWRPAGQWAFPVALDTLRNSLWSDNVLNQDPAPPAMLSRSGLLQRVAQPAVALQRANVCKRRFRFTLASCRAELDQLLVNGAALESIAIESEDPQAVLEVQSALRLEDCENQSYPLALSRLLGMTPLPGEHAYG